MQCYQAIKGPYYSYKQALMPMILMERISIYECGSKASILIGEKDNA